MSEKFHPFDILALVVIVCYFGLIIIGKSSPVDLAFNAIIGFYFGHKVSQAKPTL